MGDPNNLITNDQLERFGSELMVKMGQQLQQVIQQRDEKQLSAQRQALSKWKEKMTVSSNSSPDKEKVLASRFGKTKRRERSRRDISNTDSDDNSDATYYPPKSSRSRRTMR